MAETVKHCRENINLSLEYINIINDNINEQEEVINLLEGKVLNTEFELYLKNMRRALELIKYFEVDLVYFKDSFNISSKLVISYQ